MLIVTHFIQSIKALYRGQRQRSRLYCIIREGVEKTYLSLIMLRKHVKTNAFYNILFTGGELKFWIDKIRA